MDMRKRHQHQSRAILRFTSALTAVCLAASSAACASVAPDNPDQLAPAQMSRIGEICHSVVGLSVGSGDYATCEESLAQTVAARRQAHAVEAARQGCETRGLRPATLAFAECELDAPPPAAQADSPLDDALAPPAQSDFSASNGEIHRRLQEACVQIGEDPATGAFDACVASLSTNLWETDDLL
jgi:hypothetical protein